MGYTGFALFILGMILAIVAPINKRKNTRCSAQAPGVLIGIYRRRRGLTYLFTYHVNGVDYQLKSTAGSPEAHNSGEACTIWYNPAKPQDAQPFHYETSKIYTYLFLGGIALILVGLVLTVIGLANGI